MRTLVTGASGFIGKALIRRLLTDAHEVIAVSRTPTITDDRVEWTQADVRFPEQLEPAFKRKPEIVYHVAGLVSFQSQKKKELFGVNAEGTRHVLTLSNKYGVGRNIVVSSVAAIDPPDHGGVSDESTPFTLNSDLHPYNASKREGERIAFEFAEKGSDIVVVSPAFVFGEGDDHSPAMQLVQKISTRRIPFYPPGGICGVWIGDVVSGLLSAAKEGKSGEKYILGGENVSNAKAYQIIAKAVGGIRPRYPLPMWPLFVYGVMAEWEAALLRKPPRFTRAWARGSGIFHHYSSEKARRAFGYQPISFGKTIQRTVEWMQENRLL
jgi:dihydroflavonol-4-reductase